MVQGVHLATDFSIVHMVLALETYRMQELQNHGSFLPYFRGRPERPGNM
jgi:hypothetical protein